MNRAQATSERTMSNFITVHSKITEDDFHYSRVKKNQPETVFYTLIRTFSIELYNQTFLANITFK